MLYRTEANDALARWDDPRSFHILEPLARVGASILPDENGEYDEEVVEQAGQAIHSKCHGSAKIANTINCGNCVRAARAVLSALNGGDDG